MHTSNTAHIPLFLYLYITSPDFYRFERHFFRFVRYFFRFAYIFCRFVHHFCRFVHHLCRFCTSHLKKSTHLFTINLRQIDLHQINILYMYMLIMILYTSSHIIPDVDNFYFNTVQYFTFL